MKVKGKLKRKKLNQKTLLSLKEMEHHIKAGYPKENPQSHQEDENGHTPIFKAYQINFSNKNYVPYLQMSYSNNIIKYSKLLLSALKGARKKGFDAKLEKLGDEMVGDIKATLLQTQTSPPSTKKGCIFGAVSYKKVK